MNKTNIEDYIKKYLEEHLKIDINKYGYGGRTALYEIELKVGNNIISRVRFHGTNSGD